MCHANSLQRIKLTHTYCKSGTRQIAGHCKRGYATLWKVKREGMQQMSTKIQQIIEWRRAKVMELLSNGAYMVCSFNRIGNRISSILFLQLQ